MDKLIIEGGLPLQGDVVISGAKNASLPMLAATLLTRDRCHIRNVPRVVDVMTMLKILGVLGAQATMDGSSVTVNPSDATAHEAPYELVSTMRASICVLGPLLARHGRARVSMPGGCVIGSRPIGLHLKGLAALGVQVRIEHGDVLAEVRELRGGRVYLGGAFGSSVLATANVMMAATLAKGTTVIENAACEPEIVDLANCLMQMGAKIRGQRTHVIEIEGVSELHGVDYTVIPDRIEAGTYMIAGAITRGNVLVQGVEIDHLGAVIDRLRAAGVEIGIEAGGIRVQAPRGVHSVDVTTLPYPGFPTDLQAQVVALLCMGDGLSVVTEKIYPERFMHIAELGRMGASVFLEGASAIIKGVPSLSGAQVMASDLRASAALVLAGLVADHRTDIARVYHLDRGYEQLESKLVQLGARVQRVRE
jgi:UDP-N-acetylglucosamine 1-carboxyvinyltransferase